MTHDEMTACELSDEELKRIPKAADGNPFRHVTGHPVGLRNAKRWNIVHGWEHENAVEVKHPKNRDPFESLAFKMMVERAGFYRHENPATGAVAYFPKTARDVADFEARCLTMHANQVAVVMDDKSRGGFKFVQPGETDQPMRYEDFVKLKDAEQREKNEAAKRAKDKKNDDDNGDEPKLTRSD